jgi:hypothetical protein
MEKFRIISDLHVDRYLGDTLSFEDDVFTIVAGDTANSIEKSIPWLKKNIKNGLIISGNHLPYNCDVENKTIQELREELKENFPLDGNVTYLDCETGVYSKCIDGILFIGTCMYTDMILKSNHPEIISTQEANMRRAEYQMNDYRYSRKDKDIKCTAQDFVDCFNRAFTLIDKMLTENEQSINPKPVVLITHHSLIRDYIEYSYYIKSHDEDQLISRNKWYTIGNKIGTLHASYTSDKIDWLKSHNSIKCYCFGHIHCISKEHRVKEYQHNNGSNFLVVNNARGYADRFQDSNFNKDLFIDTTTWKIIKGK